MMMIQYDNMMMTINSNINNEKKRVPRVFHRHIGDGWQVVVVCLSPPSV